MEGSKYELEVTFPRFPHETYLRTILRKKVKLLKIFCIKFPTKMIIIKIFAIIISAKLQRFESRGKVKKTSTPQVWKSPVRTGLRKPAWSKLRCHIRSKSWILRLDPSEKGDEARGHGFLVILGVMLRASINKKFWVVIISSVSRHPFWQIIPELTFFKPVYR